ncbi:uncharacterized protein METZ01_LOCUS452968, partial [marine metagenome]
MTMSIQRTDKKIGVLIPGMGAVASTFIAGIEAIKRGLARPIGSMTQMGTIRLGKRTEKRSPIIKDFVPLADFDNLIFGGWDINKENLYEIALRNGVLEKTLIDSVREPLENYTVMKGVFDKKYVKKLDGDWVKSGPNKMELAKKIMDDIRSFNTQNNITYNVMVWCGSTEIFIESSDVHSSLKKFEEGLRKNDPGIPPSMIYAYA